MVDGATDSVLHAHVRSDCGRADSVRFATLIGRASLSASRAHSVIVPSVCFTPSRFVHPSGRDRTASFLSLPLGQVTRPRDCCRTTLDAFDRYEFGRPQRASVPLSRTKATAERPFGAALLGTQGRHDTETAYRAEVAVDVLCVALVVDTAATRSTRTLMPISQEGTAGTATAASARGARMKRRRRVLTMCT